METSSKLKIAIAGATGFVGSAIARSLGDKYTVVGLSRSKKEPTPESGISEWRSCDLYSLLDAEKALEGVNLAFYMVHSMMPSARLTQGSFEDLDLIAADNFARAAKLNGVRQIIYLGGLVPDDENDLSLHLKSRLEVEKTLGSHGVAVTALRASLILGGKGSSFQIIYRLVQRLPGMICPKWTETPTQPIALEDVVKLLIYCVDREEVFGQIFDVGGPQVTTYRELINLTAKVMGKHPILFKFPFFSPNLSRLWVKLVTGAPKDLVYPLVESLRHPMIVHDRRLQLQAGIPGIDLQTATKKAVEEAEAETKHGPKAFHKAKGDSDVRSVQRLVLPKGKTARWAAKEYLHWLSGRIFPLSVTVTGVKCVFRFLPFLPDLLVLEYSDARSTSDRALFYIKGGMLAKIQGRGRLEFRETTDGRSLLVAVHEFRPRLPWIIYAYSQARLHILVMYFFGRYLKRVA